MHLDIAITVKLEESQMKKHPRITSKHSKRSNQTPQTKEGFTMTDLASHIQICVAMKKERLLSNQMVRIIWHIANEHAEETTLEDFIKAISPATTTNSVERIKKE
jgi:hypothetical protein